MECCGGMLIILRIANLLLNFNKVLYLHTRKHKHKHTLEPPKEVNLMAFTDVSYGCVIESQQNLIHTQDIHTNQSNPSKKSSRTTLLHEKHTKMPVYPSIDHSMRNT